MHAEREPDPTTTAAPVTPNDPAGDAAPLHPAGTPTQPRTAPPGVRAQAIARTSARWLALLVLVIVAIIALAGCAGPADTTPADPHAAVDTGSGAADDGALDDGAAQDPAGSAEPTAQGATQEAVAAGIARAASFNFTLTDPATGAELETLRGAPQDTLNGVTVHPDACTSAVQDLNWSPALLGTDAARTDFAAPGAVPTGSVEVAAVTDRTTLENHYATVRKMLAECSDVSLGISGSEVPLRSSTPDVATDAADSALLWARAGSGSELQQQALVLIKEEAGHVAMVSFIAPDGLQDKKFATMAAAILDATLEPLR